MGPIGPHLPCPMGPSGPCCRFLAGCRLGLLLRHLAGLRTKGQTWDRCGEYAQGTPAQVRCHADGARLCQGQPAALTKSVTGSQRGDYMNTQTFSWMRARARRYAGMTAGFSYQRRPLRVLTLAAGMVFAAGLLASPAAAVTASTLYLFNGTATT